MTTSERVYFPVVCQLDQREHFLLWYTDDVDGLVVDSRGRLLTFEGVDAATSHATAEGFVVERCSSAHDIDQLQTWISDTEPPSASVDCSTFLRCWNLFIDVAASVDQDEEFDREDREATTIYDKLFFGCNLPAVTPTESHYEPLWSHSELAQMRTVLAAGVRLLRTAIASSVR